MIIPVNNNDNVNFGAVFNSESKYAPLIAPITIGSEMEKPSSIEVEKTLRNLFLSKSLSLETTSFSTILLLLLLLPIDKYFFFKKPFHFKNSGLNCQ